MLESIKSNNLRRKPLKANSPKVTTAGEILPVEQEFIDTGYSGATLIRPALERLRDVIAASGIDRLYVHCEDSSRPQLCPSSDLV